MKLKVTSIATSKKGRVYVSTEQIEGHPLKAGDVLLINEVQRDHDPDLHSHGREAEDGKES